MSCSPFDETHHTEPGDVILTQAQGVATLTLARPRYLNAMTWAMYSRLAEHIAAVSRDSSVKVIVLRGEGSKALAAGTDIHQFADFDGRQGIAYEKKVDSIVSVLAMVAKPTIAVIQGYAVGGGMALAAACDLRYANASARIGIPIARTLGNCLAFSTYRRLTEIMGASQVKELVYTGRLMSAGEGKATGFITNIFDDESFEPQLSEVVDAIASHAPLTLWATKTAFLRWEELTRQTIDQRIPFEEVVERVYDSQDFRQAVRSRMTKEPPTWSGQ